MDNQIPDIDNKIVRPGSRMPVIITAAFAGCLGGFLAVIFMGNSKFFKEQLRENYTYNQNTSRQPVNLVEESAIINVVKKASPAVVSIVASKDVSRFQRYYWDPFADDFFSPFFDSPRYQQPKGSEPNIQEVGSGTGFLVSADGVILTNKHVISDDQASYTVITQDSKKYEAKILASDPRNDIALVKIEAGNLPFLELADSSQIQTGQQVLAIGNSLGQYQNTVTAGIVSGIGRSITAGGQDGAEKLTGVIQTDAAINPGNSGGPLLNLFGQVVGVNTAIDRQGQLVGFAIPSNDAKKALDSYKKNGKITRPYIGVRYVTITKELAKAQNLPREYGALIVRGETFKDFAVIPGSPADKAGLVENDIILEVDGKKVEEGNTLSEFLKNHEAGEIVNLKIYHKGGEKNINIKLEEAK